MFAAAEVQGIAGATPVLAPAALVASHAFYTGGPLPAAASVQQRLAYRSANAWTTLALLDPSTGVWLASPLYDGLEQTEKAFGSYRLGTTIAGVLAELGLDVGLLVHAQTIFGMSTGPRGDMVGLSTITGLWHGVEAKGKSPMNGGYRAVAAPQYQAAKAQAAALGALLAGAGGVMPTAQDHWAITTRTSTLALMHVVLDDPLSPGHGGGGGEPPPDEADFPQHDPQERLLQGYYQVLGDIETAAGDGSADAVPPRVREFGDFRGVWLDGGRLWVGAQPELYAARLEQRLSRIVPLLLDTNGSFHDQEIAVSPSGVVLLLNDAVDPRPRGLSHDPPTQPVNELSQLREQVMRRRNNGKE